MKHGVVPKIELREGRPIREIIIDLYNQHGNQTAVAAALGISQSRLSQIMSEQNLTVKQVIVAPERSA